MSPARLVIRYGLSLCISIGLGAGQPAFTCAAPAERPLVVLIDDFEPRGPGPTWLAKGGPSMLKTALFRAADGTPISFKFVEREKIEAVLAEAGIGERLSGVMDHTKVISELRGAGAQFVIFAEYFEQTEDLVRIEARVVEIKTLSTTSGESHLFRPSDRDPLQPLGDKLIRAIGQHLHIRFGEHATTMLFAGFDIPGEKSEGMEAARTIPKVVMEAIHGSKPRDLRMEILPEDLARRQKNMLVLFDMYPNADFILYGDIVALDRERGVYAISARVVRRGEISAELVAIKMVRCSFATLFRDLQALAVIFDKIQEKAHEDLEEHLAARGRAMPSEVRQ